MQTKKLALLSTMLVGLGGATVAAQSTDAAEDASDSATQQVQQQADAAADATKDATTEAKKNVEDMASDAAKPADASQDTASDATTEPADASQDTASDATTEPADAGQDTASDATTESGGSESDGGVLLVRTMSVGTSDQAYEGEVFAGMTAEDVIGMTVVGRENESVGEVSDLLINDDGTVDRAIVDVGGFLGFGTKSVALEIDSLSISEGSGEIISDVDAETLESMPEWQQEDDGWYSE